MLTVATAFLMSWILLGGLSTPLDLALPFLFGFWEGWAVIAFGRLLAASVTFALSRGVFPVPIPGNKLGAVSMMPFARCIGAVQATIRDSPWQASCMLRLTYIPSAFTNYGLALLPVALMPAPAYFIPMLILEPLSAFVPACIGASATSGAADFQIPAYALVLAAVAFVASGLILAQVTSGIAQILADEIEHRQRESEAGLAHAARREGADGTDSNQDYPYSAFATTLPF